MVHLIGIDGALRVEWRTKLLLIMMHERLTPVTARWRRVTLKSKHNDMMKGCSVTPLKENGNNIPRFTKSYLGNNCRWRRLGAMVDDIMLLVLAKRLPIHCAFMCTVVTCVYWRRLHVFNTATEVAKTSENELWFEACASHEHHTETAQDLRRRSMVAWIDWSHQHLRHASINSQWWPG